LSNFDGNGTDMLKVINGYLAHLAEQNYDNPQGERSLKAEKPTVDGRYIKVTMHSGEYGVQSMFSDKHSGEQVFERQNTHVEETPIRNLFFIPRGFQAGL